MTEKTYTIKMAVATQEDFETVYRMNTLAQILDEYTGHGKQIEYMSDSERRPILLLAQLWHNEGSSAFARVLGCAATLMSEGNGLIDQKSDVLEFSPELKRVYSLVDSIESGTHLDKLKGPMRGEHSFQQERSCSACNYDIPTHDCEVCNGDIEYIENVDVPWDTQKEIINHALRELGFKFREGETHE
ncbi:hypothetical protein [Vibrio sp. ER1A]|uniref:hypothetical protein n=1 Tax=Vibrio sp. ER1A TaxID=1517681 RepID=UPI0004DCC4A6|nr:hypothetical protein [Vibrio sp. ER1A]KFA99461.1 hypothetical protein HW45_03625 [Vibrio sp. ER1A]